MGMDKHKQGSISKAVFLSHLKDEEVQEFFKTAEIDHQDAQLIFELLDESGDGTVRLDEFTHGILRLVGGAKGTDLVMLHLEHRRLAGELNDFMRFSEARITSICKALGLN